MEGEQQSSDDQVSGSVDGQQQRVHPSPARRLQFSQDDTVQRIDDPSVLGIVTRLGGRCSNQDSDTCSSDEEEDDFHLLSPGLARVMWCNTQGSTTEQLSGLELVDRSLKLGDIVARSSDPLGQSGIVYGVEVFVDLEYPNGEVVKNVNSKLLRRVRSFVAGDYVVKDYWVGRVDQVVDNVTVLFSDGAKCKVLKADPDRLRPLGVPYKDDDELLPYYPGVRVRTSTPVFRTAKWLKGSWKPNRSEGTVVHVESSLVYVYWMGVGHAPAKAAVPPVPAEQQDARGLARLDLFDHMAWEVGDRSLPPKLQPGDNEIVKAPQSDEDSEPGETSEEVKAETSAEEVKAAEDTGHREEGSRSERGAEAAASESPGLYLRKHRRCTIKREKKKPKKKNQPYEPAVLVSRTRRVVSVVWQDGTQSQGVPATALVAVHYPGDNDYWPEHHVVERGTDDSVNKRHGIVKSVDAKERTARVKWYKQQETLEDPLEFEGEETVSVYELREHSDFDYCLGDIVIRLPPVEGKEAANTDSVTSQQPDQDQEELKQPEEAAQRVEEDAHTGYRQKEKTSKKTEKPHEVQDVSFVGFIVGLDDGNVEVEWGHHQRSKAGPRTIFVLTRDEDDEEESDEDDDDAASWETVESDRSEDLEEPEEATETGALVDRAVKKAIGESSVVPSDEADTQLQESKDDELEENEAILDNDEDSSEAERAKPLPSTVPEGTTEATSFKHFDIVKDASDHQYFQDISEVPNQRRWLKQVQKEWNVLQANLPDSVFVRIYEDRMDLLRAVILGAAGTPYHDGIFVFDFYLPPDYPLIPPAVNYHSGGLRLNPNLYENGKVCLSLLNTWTGKGTELWNPGTSNILQVLVSIQGLVLNAKPYFNEAGYDRQTGTGEGEKNSIAYNENTFLLSCRSMMYLVRQPPMHFEEFIRNHFRACAPRLIKCCRAYLDGVPVGYLTEDGERPAELTLEGSAGFKLMLSKLLPKLAAAFAEIGCTEWREAFCN